MFERFRFRHLARELDTIARAHERQGTFAGAVLVARNGAIIHQAGYGMADREARVPNQVGTTYRIGSVSKTITALAVLRLAENRRLDLDDPVARFLPSFPGGDRIRLHHLLSNTSGIPDFLMLQAVLPNVAQGHAIDEVIAYFRDEPRLFAPGAQLSYSNSNWTLLAKIVEQVCGAAFAEALGHLVLEPLRLDSTTVDHEPPRKPAARGYTLRDDEWVDAPVIDMSIEVGCGGLRSTVHDLERLDRALARPGFLSAPILARMKQPVHRTEDGIGYGLGLFSLERWGHALEGHSGGTFGFTAYWSRYPLDRLTVVVLANVDNGSGERVERDLAAAALGVPYELPGQVAYVTVPVDVLDRCTADTGRALPAARSTSPWSWIRATCMSRCPSSRGRDCDRCPIDVSSPGSREGTWYSNSSGRIESRRSPSTGAGTRWNHRASGEPVNVRLLVLGLLSRSPMHGYELKRVAEESRIQAWTGILPGSIYHALRQLTREGLLTLRATESTGARTREVYAITPQGRMALKALVREEWTAPVRSFPVSLYGALSFRGLLSPGEERAALDAQVAKVEEEIALWQSGRKLKGPLTPELEALFDNALAHLRADLALLQRLRARPRPRRV